MRLLQWILIGVLACGVSACGNKGKLKSPTQIEEREAKKARKQAKLKEEKAPSPLEGEGRVEGGSADSMRGETPPPNPLPQGEGE